MLRYSSYDDGWQTKLYTARRLLMLVPVLVFLITLVAFAGTTAHSSNGFAQLVMRVTAVSMATSIVCMGIYGFYRYHLDHSYGL